MPRVRPLSRDEADPSTRVHYDRDLKYFGEVLNPTGVLAYRPPIMTAARELGASMGRGAMLGADLRAMICTFVAQLVGCPF